MAKDFKGRIFLELTLEAITPEAPLRCDVFVFLPLNNRMIKVRAEGQSLAKETLDLYRKNGHAKLFILDPEQNPESFNLKNVVEGVAFNPNLPPEVAGRLLEKAKAEALALGSVQAETKKELAGEIIEKSASEEAAPFSTSDKKSEERSSEDNSNKKAELSAEEEQFKSAEKGEAEEESEEEVSANEKSKEELQATAEGAFEEKKAPSEEEFGQVEASEGKERKFEFGAFESKEKESGDEEERDSEAEIDSEKDSDNALKAEDPESGEEESDGSERGRRAKRERALEEGEEFSAEVEDGEKKLRGKKAKEEEEQKFRSDEEEEVSRKVKGEEEETDQSEKRFKGDSEALEEEVLFKGSKEPREKDEEDLEVERESGWSLEGESKEKEERKKISGDIRDMEEELASFSPDSKEFVEELKKIEAGEAESNNEEWKLTVPDALPILKGLDKEEAAAVKLAHAVGKKLGHLRRELNAASKTIPKTEKERAELSERRKELRKEIAKLEETSVLLEAIDDQEVDKKNLPEKFQEKTKQELVAELEKNLEEFKGTSLLAEEDFKQVDKKLKKVKAKEFEEHATNIQAVKEKVAEKLKAVKEEGAEKPSREELAELQEEVEKEIRTAKISAKVTKAATKMREKLQELLDEKPKTKAERKAIEEKAKKLQDGIQKLEELELSLEAGEEVDPKLLAPFEPEESKKIDFVDSDPQAMQLMLSELEILKQDMVNAKMAASEAQDSLLKKINGPTNEEKEEETKLKEEKKQLESKRSELEQQEAELRALNSEGPKAESLRAMKQEFLSKQAMALAEGKELSESDVGEMHRQMVKEAEKLEAVIKIESRIRQDQEMLQKLLQQKPSSEEEKKLLEQKALGLQKSINELQSLKAAVNRGDPVESKKLAPFQSPLPKEYVLKAGEPPQKAMDRMLRAMGDLQERAEDSKSALREAEKKVAQQLNEAAIEPVKKESMRVDGINDLNESLSRRLEHFVKTGKNPDPNEVWEINHLIQQKVQEAAVERNIARRVAFLGKEIEAMTQMKPSSEREYLELQGDINKARLEMRRLNDLQHTLEDGARVEMVLLKDFQEEVPKEYVIKGDGPIQEEMTRIMNSVAHLKEEVVNVKMGAAEAVNEHLIKEPKELEMPQEMKQESDEERAEREAEEEMLRKVPEADAKEIQAGVYAATLIRYFGYKHPEIEQDLMLATFLWKHSQEEIQDAFPERVLTLHRAAKEISPEDEMIVKDLGLAVRLAREYLELPGVVTGRFSLDNKLFPSFCKTVLEKFDEAIDPQLVERAKQGVQAGMVKVDRENIVDVAKHVNQKYHKWKQQKAGA